MSSSLSFRTYAVLTIFAALLFAACATSGNLSRRNEDKLAGRTYVITGASSGLGRGTAVQLAKYKANIVLAARRTDVLEEVAREIRAAGGTALVVTTDVSKPEDVQALADAAVKAFGKIDVWVNNAAVGTIGPYWNIPVEEQARAVDINYKGVLYGSAAAMKIFRAQGYGLLLNTGSVESEVPLAYHSVYAGTKAAVRHFGLALNQELRLAGYKGKIWVVTVMPWATDTPFWRHAANHSGGTPRMAAIDGPQKVVNAMVWASLHRKPLVPVGWKGKGANRSHRIFPRITEKVSANIMHKWQIKNAPPAPETSGSLFTAMPGGRGVDDSVKARVRAEERARKAARD